MKVLDQVEQNIDLNKGEFVDMGTTPISVFNAPEDWPNTMLR